jgi:hypothetical protein
MSNAENPRAVVGSNQAPDYAQRVTEQMASEYAALNDSISALLEEARSKPTEVTSDEVALDIGALIKRLGDADRRAEAFRVAEAEPYLRGKNAVDGFFNALRDKIGRRNKNDRAAKPGAVDILQARVTAYLEKKRIEEQARRDAEAARLREEARQRQLAEAAAAAAAEEARKAAERARKPEIVEQKTAVAQEAAAAAAAARAESEVATGQAIEAHISTLAKPADMARTRGDEGVLLTLAKESYAIVLDRSKLDMAKLAPFFTDTEVEKALRAWAKNTGYAQPMDGAEIGKKNKGVTR